MSDYEERKFRLTPKGFLYAILMQHGIGDIEAICDQWDDKVFRAGWSYVETDELAALKHVRDSREL